MSVLQETKVHLLLSLQCQLQGSPPSQKLQSSMCRMSMARGRLCDIGDSPNSVATGRETVPTVSPAWASTHQDTTTEPFQTTTTAVRPVAWGKAGLDSGVDYFTSGRLETTFLLLSLFKDAFESG